MHQQQPVLLQHRAAVAHEHWQVGILGEIGRRNAIERLLRAVVLGAREHELDVVEPAQLVAGDLEVFLAQLDADHAARGKAPGNGEGRDAGAAGKVQDSLGAGGDALDDAAFPEAIDAEGRGGDHEVVGAAGAAEEALHELQPLVVAGHAT
jgi:hypothetical protein